MTNEKSEGLSFTYTFGIGNLVPRLNNIKTYRKYVK